MRIDSGENRSGGNCEYTEKSKNKQIFIDRVRNDWLRNDRVRYNRVRLDSIVDSVAE